MKPILLSFAVATWLVFLCLLLAGCAQQTVKLDFFTCAIRQQENGIIVIECGDNDKWNDWNEQQKPHPAKSTARET